MIYVSASCLKGLEIKDAIEALYKNGFRHIELSGGFRYYDKMEKDLIKAKRRFNLDYICHNYFFHSGEPLVLNLASLNDDIYEKSLNFLIRAIKLAKKLNAKKFGLHAGFFLDIKEEEIGKDLTYSKPFNKDKCIKKFYKGFSIIKEAAEGLELYIENNIISSANLKTFKGLNPFMMTRYKEYSELKKIIDFKLLLDIGHLKVSSFSLGLNFEEELDKMMAASDYLHISDNNGLSDQNRCLLSASDVFQKLKKYNLKGKIITMEIYEKMDEIKKSYSLLKGAIK